MVRADPVITATRPTLRHDPAMPFIGLAEAYALAAFRHADVPMHRIRPAIDALDRQLGLSHALASRRLYTDGAEVLYDYAQHAGGTPEGEIARELVVVRNNQRVFTEAVEQYLSRVDFSSDGYARLIRLPQYRVAEVTVDPDHAFGRPRFARGGASLDDVIDLFRAGEPVDVVAEEFGLTRDEVEDAIRASSREAASQNWPILMKEKRIRTRQAEIETVVENKARCFAHGQPKSVAPQDTAG